MEEKLLQMKSLVERLNQASDSYYNGKGELMTDYEWDALFDQLKRLEEETGEILPDSPTNRVSEDSIVGKKEEHEFAALSLAKTKQVSDLVKWAEDRPIWISWKAAKQKRPCFWKRERAGTPPASLNIPFGK